MDIASMRMLWFVVWYGALWIVPRQPHNQTLILRPISPHSRTVAEGGNVAQTLRGGV